MRPAFQLRILGSVPAAAAAATAREKAAKLDAFQRDLMACRVTIERLGADGREGRSYAVRIDVTMASGALCVDRVRHEDVCVALRDAFDAMRARIEDSARVAAGRVSAPAAERNDIET
jgi:hypothetical protein